MPLSHPWGIKHMCTVLHICSTKGDCDDLCVLPTRGSVIDLLQLGRICGNNITVFLTAFPVLKYPTLVRLPTEWDGGSMCVLFARCSVLLDCLWWKDYTGHHGPALEWLDASVWDINSNRVGLVILIATEFCNSNVFQHIVYCDISVYW